MTAIYKDTSQPVTEPAMNNLSGQKERAMFVMDQLILKYLILGVCMLFLYELWDFQTNVQLADLLSN